jgi:hypothetical protein
MGKMGSRQDSAYKAVSTAPSINKTPVGSSTPPLPYPTTQDLGNSTSVATTVLFNDNPAYTLNQSEQPSCKGDNPGTANGVKSGTVNGYVKPTGAAGAFKAEKHYVVRQGDGNVMNGGNNPGIYVTTQIPSVSVGGATSSDNAPPIEPETPEEMGFLSNSVSSADGPLGSLAGTGKVLAMGAVAAKAGAALAPCASFIPGQKG